MGAFGLALIAPMLFMVLDRYLKTSLITISAGTIIFAFALAVSARSLRGMDVLAATPAYTAVLVVLVGTSIPHISGRVGSITRGASWKATAQTI
jgi:hypothetical protein